MSILVWIVFGLVVGLIARAVFPGRQSMGLITTMLLGIAGSLLGGVIGNLLVGVDPMNADRFDLTGAGFIGSLLGSLAILEIVGMVKRPSLGADRPTAH